MKKNNRVISCSLAVILTVTSGVAFAALRTGNAGGSYAGSYKNTMALQQQYNNYIAAAEAENAETATAEVELPVRVADADLAERIKAGDTDTGVTFTKLDACSMIYPGGEFEWDRPTLGSRAGGAPTCVAVVEMRFVGKGITGNSMDLPVARGKLAAGDMLKCNISNFPQSSYLPDIANVVFPADKAPTRQDVINVMNQEQKSKAGLKIAAGLLVGGIGGNLSGKNDAGKDGLFGTSKNKLKNTAIGATAGAALMTASTFSGKVAGDVIMSAGVNAAAGGLVGNMSGMGDSVLRIEKCEGPSGETTCLWGRIQKKGELQQSDTDKLYFYNYSSRNWMVCEKDKSNENKGTNCHASSSFSPTEICGTSLSSFETKNSTEKKAACKDQTRYKNEDSGTTFVMKETDDETGYIQIDVEYVEKNAGAAKRAVVLNFPEARFGSKIDDWYKWLAQNRNNATVCWLDGKNTLDCNSADEDLKIDNFKPVHLEADDGDLIDFSNKARLGATAKGAGLGGAIGGYSGYQGAQSDIDERMTLAMREYNDSLEKVYCGTGQKFLSFYNDEMEIPLLTE